MKLRILLAALVSLALFAWRPAMAQERAYMLGVISYGDSPQMIATEYEGLTNYLSRVLKRPVRIEGARNFDIFAQRAKAKHYHMMFVAPSAVLDANRSAGYLPVAKIPGLLSVSFMAPGRTNIAFPEDMKDHGRPHQLRRRHQSACHADQLLRAAGRRFDSRNR